MAHSAFPFEFKSANSSTALTSFSGLALFFELLAAMKFPEAVARCLPQGPSRAWTDVQILSALAATQLVGGDCLEDLDRLDQDEGFRRLLDPFETRGLTEKQRRRLKKRFPKPSARAVPSPDSAARYLARFNTPLENAKLAHGRAQVPAPNDYLQGLAKLLARTCHFAQEQRPAHTATLDIDAASSPPTSAAPCSATSTTRPFSPSMCSGPSTA